jgi:hypothetical protein
MGELGKKYYWITASLNGRLVIIGPKLTEFEAENYAYQTLTIPYRIVGLSTRDRAKATSQLKAMRLDQTGDLGGSLRRARHQAPDMNDSGGNDW